MCARPSGLTITAPSCLLKKLLRIAESWVTMVSGIVKPSCWAVVSCSSFLDVNAFAAGKFNHRIRGMCAKNPSSDSDHSSRTHRSETKLLGGSKLFQLPRCQRVCSGEIQPPHPGNVCEKPFQ